nr:structural protein [Riboviria sp.]
MKELRMRLNAFDTNSTPRSTTVRVIIFSDSMGSGSAVGITELLSTAANYSQYSGINRQRHRFKVFYDDYFSVIAATNYQERPHNIHFSIDQKRYFNDASATASNIGKNAMYLLVLGSTTNVTFDFSYQLTYTDS